MPFISSTLKRVTILLCCWVYATVAFSQPVDINKKNNTLPNASMGRVLRTTATEICNNLIDDDNNKLADEKDFSCYFTGLTRSTCKKSSMIWAIDAGGNLYWVDMSTGSTGTQNFVGSNQYINSDITWASNGKLYGTGGFPNGIWEIDPNSGGAKFVNKLPDNYSAGVAMTADAAGNLYITASLNGQVNIVKLNIATWEQCVVADLSSNGIFPSGDLTFLDGMLYMSGTMNKVAKINVKTGAVNVQSFVNNAPAGYYGMVNIGDGSLYVAQNKNIYQVNPLTMEVSNTPAFKLSSVWDIYGLAGYYELCQSPACTARTNITPNDNPPYCPNQNIKLKAAFYRGCSSGTPSITWSWYTTGSNLVSGDEVEASTPGKYYLNYQTPTETCDRIDSFIVQYATNAPFRAHGEYQLPAGCSCTGTITVKAGCGSGNFKYEWSTGAATPAVSNVCPGKYSVKITDITQGRDTTIYIIIPSPPNSIQDAAIVTTADHCNQRAGSITIDQVQGGTAPYQYALNNQPFVNSSTFPALSKGNYAITIRDNTGCVLQKQAVIQAAPGPEKIWYTKKDAYCGLPGTIIIDSVKNGSSPYTYALGSAPFTQQTTFTNITPGPNTIRVRDNYGCLVQEPLTIYQSEALLIAISPKDTTICASQKITFRATLLSNNAGVQYYWDAGQPSTSATFNTAVYADKVMVVQAIDKNGCTTADSAFITAPYCDSLFAKCVIFPSAFSPNQNGLNDTFGAHLGSCEIKTFKLVIYNRWGQVMFQSGNAQYRWNGTINGNEQPSGIYVYSCVWEDPMGYVHRHKGTVMLIR